MRGEIDLRTAVRISALLRSGVERLQLRTVDAMVLAVLLVHADAVGSSAPSYADLERQAGATRGAVKAALQRLLTRSVILLAEPRRGSKPAVYVIGPDIWEV